MPPETGYIPPSSACTSASTRMQTAPMIHEMIAAGPAMISASWAPKSQPEPMIEPIDAHISPTSPTSRSRERLRSLGSFSSVATTTSCGVRPDGRYPRLASVHARPGLRLLHHRRG